MTEWQTPGGQTVMTEDEAKEKYGENSIPIDVAISIGAIMVIGTLCALVLHWAGVL